GRTHRRQRRRGGNGVVGNPRHVRRPGRTAGRHHGHERGSRVRRALALLVVLALAWTVTHLNAPQGAPTRVTGLALGVALIAAYLAGVLLERLRLPKVTGYLLFGLFCG